MDNPRLRERRFVFSSRHDAGRQLGAFLKTLPALNDPYVLAIPAGGVPIGKEVARALSAPFSLAIVPEDPHPRYHGVGVRGGHLGWTGANQRRTP